MVPLYRSLMLFILLKCMFPEMSPLIRWASGSSIPMAMLCGPTKVIRAEEGSDAILPVHESRTGPFTWRFDTGNFFQKFARTEAGGKVQEIDERFMEGVSSARFKGRVSGTEDGSLIIANVSTNDPEGYFEWSDEGGCVQEYRLLIYSMFPEMSPLIRWTSVSTIPMDKVCGPKKVISAEEGSDAILPVHESRTGPFTWRFNNGKFVQKFARTEAGGKVQEIDERFMEGVSSAGFKGRVSGTEDGSLIIANVSSNDPEGYFEFADEGGCVQEYRLAVYRSAPIPDQNVNEEKQTGHGTPQPDPETD